MISSWKHYEGRAAKVEAGSPTIENDEEERERE
jgi:hypothetical protein